MVLTGFLVVLCLVFASWSLLSAYRLFHPKSRSLTSPETAVAWTEHALTAEDGVALPVWEIAAENPVGLVLLCHGYFANRFQVSGVASRLAESGYTALVMEMRGHGKRSASPCTLGFKEAKDAISILQWAWQRPQWASLPTAVLGFSMGAAVLCPAAVGQPQVGAFIADSIYARLLPQLSQGLKQEYHLWPIPWAYLTWWMVQGILRTRLSCLDPVVMAPRGSKPLLVIHGGCDQRVAPSSTEAFYSLWQGAKQRWFDPEAVHVGVFSRNPKQYMERVTGFLAAALR